MKPILEQLEPRLLLDAGPGYPGDFNLDGYVTIADLQSYNNSMSAADYIKLKTQSQCHIPYALDAYFESYRMTQPLFLLDNKTKTNNSIDRIKSWYFIKEGND